jgi:hypothetical protein
MILDQDKLLFVSENNQYGLPAIPFYTGLNENRETMQLL